MPYKEGSWGYRAKARSKKRLDYFNSRYGHRQVMGQNLSKNFNFTIFFKERELKCQLCGKLPISERFKGLLIHHKDRDITNNDFKNLLIICRGCHNRVHKRKKKSK